MTVPAPAPASDSAFALRPRIGLVVGPLLFAAMLLLPPPDGMSVPGWRTAAVAVLMAVWWITEAIPIPATALLPIVLLPLLGVATIAAATAPYANPVVYLFLGGFVIAIAIERCGLHRRIALGIMRVVGTSPAGLVAGFMVATGALSMWISNTATVLMMLPMALSVVALADAEGGSAAGQAPGQGTGAGAPDGFALALLLGVAYGASIGGLGTLIGTPPNALLAGYMMETHQVQIGFGQWMLFGVPLVLLLLPICWLLLTRVLFPLRGGRVAGGAAMLARERAALGPVTRAERTVAVVTVLTALAWVTQPLLARVLPGVTDTGIAVAGALLLFLVPVDWRRGEFAVTWHDTARLPWEVLLLYGGGFSLAAAIQETGVARWIGESLVVLQGWPLPFVVATVTAVVVYLTELTSNTATAAAFLPVVGALAIGIGADPLTLAIPAAVAASCAFMLPVATPPNAIVYGSGRVTIAQMARAGMWLNVLCIVLVTGLVLTLGRLVFGV